MCARSHETWRYPLLTKRADVGSDHPQTGGQRRSPPTLVNGPTPRRKPACRARSGRRQRSPCCHWLKTRAAHRDEPGLCCLAARMRSGAGLQRRGEGRRRSHWHVGDGRGCQQTHIHAGSPKYEALVRRWLGVGQALLRNREACSGSRSATSRSASPKMLAPPSPSAALWPVRIRRPPPTRHSTPSVPVERRAGQRRAPLQDGSYGSVRAKQCANGRARADQWR